METEKIDELLKIKVKTYRYVYSLIWLGKVGNSWYFTIRLHSWFMFDNNHIGYDCFVGVVQSLSAELSKSYHPGIV